MSKRAKTGLGSSAEGGKRQKLSFHFSFECFGLKNQHKYISPFCF